MVGYRVSVAALWANFVDLFKILNILYLCVLWRVFKGCDDVRLMRPPSPISQTPDTQQESEKGPAPMEPDTTQPGTSREVTDSLVTMLRWVHLKDLVLLIHLCKSWQPEHIVFILLRRVHGEICVSRTMLRYFFPPAFRIPKDDVNSMTAEELVAFPLVR